MEVAVNEIMLVLNKQAITKVKVILQLTKKRKIPIGVSMKKNAKADQDHQKGKDTREVSHTLSKIHLTIMIEKTINNQDQDHQKGKDTREVGHTLSKVHLTMVLKNIVNN